jgi:hypothetical protein
MSAPDTEAFRQHFRRETGDAAKWAADHGVSYEYVRLLRKGQREPSDRILAAVGWERVTTLRPTNTATASDREGNGTERPPAADDASGIPNTLIPPELLND